MSRKVLIDNNPFFNPPFRQTFKPVTIIIDNNPNNYLLDGILDVSIKRLLPNKPSSKSKIKKIHILPPKKK